MNVAQLDHIVYQMRHRGEYIGKDRKADAYGDGTFIHAWVPGMFDDAENPFGARQRRTPHHAIHTQKRRSG